MKFEGGSDLFTTNRHTIHNSSAGTYIYIYISGAYTGICPMEGGRLNLFYISGGEGLIS